MTEQELARAYAEKVYPIEKGNTDKTIDWITSNRMILEVGFLAGRKSKEPINIDDIRQAIVFAFNAGRRMELKALPPDFNFEVYQESLIQKIKEK